MEKLRTDITSDILSRLPIESVLQSKRVCKTWRALLGCDTKVGLLFSIALHKRLGTGVQLYYAERQFNEINRVIDNDDQVQQNQCSYKTLTKIEHNFIQRGPTNIVMVGSCNDLVCFIVFHHRIEDPVYVCNPITGENIHLPRMVGVEGKAYPLLRLVSGFGYNYSTNEYKVVRIYYDRSQAQRVGKVQVYTIGGGSSSTGWRDIGEITYLFCAPGIFLNGALHWLDYRERCNIVAFDLEEEEFRLLQSPPCNFRTFKVELALLGGNLCVFHTDGGKCVDIWALKKNNKRKNSSSYGMKEQEYHQHWSWCREFNIVWEGQKDACYEPFALTKNNEILLRYNGILSCYDPKTATLKKLWDDDTAWLNVQAIAHMNSLVSLEALGEKPVKAEHSHTS